MTAEEIKDVQADGRTTTGWLKEIAYQLARLNEREQEKPAVTIKRK